MNWYELGNEKLETCKKIEIFWLKKIGYLNNIRSGTVSWRRNSKKTGSVGIFVMISEENKFIRFNYTETNRATGNKKDYNYENKIVSTPCYYGGERYWFICGLSVNGKYCGRRVGVLYLTPDGGYFGCRHCHNLTYESRNKSLLSKQYPFSVIELRMKIGKLQNEIKTPYYAGQPTRKYRQLQAMYVQINRDFFLNENKNKI